MANSGFSFFMFAYQVRRDMWQGWDIWICGRDGISGYVAGIWDIWIGPPQQPFMFAYQVREGGNVTLQSSPHPEVRRVCGKRYQLICMSHTVQLYPYTRVYPLHN
jgi:hypothetical protein